MIRNSAAGTRAATVNAVSRRRRPATSSGFASRSPARRTRRRATDHVAAVKIRFAIMAATHTAAGTWPTNSST